MQSGSAPDNSPGPANQTSKATDSGTPLTPEDLQALIEKFNETSMGLQKWNQQLQAEVIRLKEELHQKNLELERKERLSALGEMAAGVAHEIRNPLGGISLYASLLERSLAGEEEKIKHVKKISEGIWTLNTIVEDMLSFTSNRPLEITPVSLSDLVKEALDWVPAEVGSDQVQIQWKKSSSDDTAPVDGEKVRRAFLNIILNSIQATKNDGKITLETGAKKRDGKKYAFASFSDTGGGVPDEVMEKIFNPFFTTRDKGVGLGLAIVHRTVEQHNGFIDVVNTGKGACFTLAFPMEVEDTAA